MTAFIDRFWLTDDGLRLHARDYAGGQDGRPPILCIPGLTRNARDFEVLATRLSPAWRVIAVDPRGRGESAAARDPASYVPASYLRDLVALLDELALPRVVAFGTSLGGIIAMMLAGEDRVAAALLNDVGPEIEPTGAQRIRAQVGRSSVWPTWMHAARALAEAQGEIHPDWGLTDWLAMAKRVFRLNAAGRIVLDYDLRIAEPLRAPAEEPAPDLWGALATLAGVPVAVIRGERSDVLAAGVAARMVAMLPGAELTVVPRTGHAPTLAEPAASAAVDRLLARVAGD